MAFISHAAHACIAAAFVDEPGQLAGRILFIDGGEDKQIQAWPVADREHREGEMHPADRQVIESKPRRSPAKATRQADLGWRQAPASRTQEGAGLTPRAKRLSFAASPA
jgi:hypothetical protein